MRVVVLGGGVGGLVAAGELSRKLGRQAEVTLVDKEGKHYFPPSYPWLAMGWRSPDQLWRPLDQLKVRGVRVWKTEVVGIHPKERAIATTAGDLAYDYLVISLGAELDPRVIEGFTGAAHHFYDLGSATRLRDLLRSFRGGKVVVGVSRLPFKCPAAPYECALLMDYVFRKRRIRDRVEMEFFTPEPWPVPAAGEGIGRSVQHLLEERDIPVHTRWEMAHVDPEARIVHFKGDGQLRYDLLVAVPPHTTCAPVMASGLAKDGPWIPVDRYTMRSSYDDVYAVGDVAKVPTPQGNVPILPKAGVFAEGQAKVAAANIVADIAGGEGARWRGYGACFLEVGHGKAGMVRGSFFKEGGRNSGCEDRAGFGTGARSSSRGVGSGSGSAREGFKPRVRDENMMAETTAKTAPENVPFYGEPCDICGAPTLEIHCKVICRNCGYIRDCSDP